jgi:N-acetylneuraminate synthase
MLRSPVDKDAVARELEPLRELFTKSVVARADLEAGTVLRREHLAARKPGTGIPARELPELLGARLLRDIKAGELLDPADVIRL